VGAVIFREGPEVLAFQRRPNDRGGGWEFPGGKCEGLESLEQALLREINEELGVAGKILISLGSMIHHYPQRSIELHLFVFEPDSWNFKLQDHQALVWLSESKALQWNWVAADFPWIPKVFAALRSRKF
jgi:mutator protein MutT